MRDRYAKPAFHQRLFFLFCVMLVLASFSFYATAILSAEFNRPVQKNANYTRYAIAVRQLSRINSSRKLMGASDNSQAFKIHMMKNLESAKNTKTRREARNSLFGGHMRRQEILADTQNNVSVYGITGDGNTQAWAPQSAGYGTTGVALVLFQANSDTLQSMMRYLSFIADGNNSTSLGVGYTSAV